MRHICLSVYKTKCVCVCVCVCLCVCLQLPGYVSKNYTKNQTGSCSLRSNKLATTAGLPTPSQKFILAAIFLISGQNPSVGLELMICILNLKWIDWYLCYLFLCFFISFFNSGLNYFFKSKQMVETYIAKLKTEIKIYT